MRSASVFFFSALCAHAQLTLSQAVEEAAKKYPAITASFERASGASASIALARTAFLPRADILAQINRATHNNVFGMLLAQTTLAPISGPVLPVTASSVWSTATGALVTWEPIDFGLRNAQVDAARKSEARAKAEVAVTRLDVSAAAADAFLTILAARQTVAAARAGVERARAIETTTGALVRAELRPGADASRAAAEVALAQTQQIRAEQAVDEARASLAALLGVAPSSIEIAAGPLLSDAPQPAASPDAAQHPAAVAQSAAIDEVRAREFALDRTWYPRFLVQGATYARGTGVDPPGVSNSAAYGLAPNVANWGVGLTMQFNLTDRAQVRARQAIEAANERAESARLKQVVQDVNGRIERARAALAGSRRVAASIPPQVEAARATVDQASARYKSGLGAVVEVAEAQRLLTQSEIDLSLGKLGVWRAMLALAAAEGDLTAFLETTK